MKTKLQKGDRVQLLPAEELLEIFNQRKFFGEDFREEAAGILGSAEGTVDSIEDKYRFDYFFFLPDGKTANWSVPYEAVDTVITTIIPFKK